MAQHTKKLVLLLLLAGAVLSSSAQSITHQIHKFSTGESVQFLGDSVSLKYFPAASANCSSCYLAFKLGALSELDAVRFIYVCTATRSVVLARFAPLPVLPPNHTHHHLDG